MVIKTLKGKTIIVTGAARGWQSNSRTLCKKWCKYSCFIHYGRSKKTAEEMQQNMA